MNQPKTALLVLVATLTGCQEGSRVWGVNAALSGQGETSFLAGYRDDSGFVKRHAANRMDLLWQGEPGTPLSGIWSDSDVHAVAVGTGNVVVFEGGHSTQVLLDAARTPLRAVWGSASSEIHVVGHEGKVFRGDGNHWEPMASPTQNDLHALWGSSKTDVFAVGKLGTIIHFDGTSWSIMPSGTDRTLSGVWGSAANDVYAVGGTERETGYIILHYDGVSWTTMTLGDTRMVSLLGIDGTAATNIYAVGGYRMGANATRGLILHYDGQAWTEAPCPINQFLWDVRATENQHLVVGPDDTWLTIVD